MHYYDIFTVSPKNTVANTILLFNSLFVYFQWWNQIGTFKTSFRPFNPKEWKQHWNWALTSIKKTTATTRGYSLIWTFCVGGFSIAFLLKMMPMMMMDRERANLLHAFPREKAEHALRRVHAKSYPSGTERKQNCALSPTIFSLAVGLYRRNRVSTHARERVFFLSVYSTIREPLSLLCISFFL